MCSLCIESHWYGKCFIFPDGSDAEDDDAP